MVTGKDWEGCMYRERRGKGREEEREAGRRKRLRTGDYISGREGGGGQMFVVDFCMLDRRLNRKGVRA